MKLIFSNDLYSSFENSMCVTRSECVTRLFGHVIVCASRAIGRLSYELLSLQACAFQNDANAATRARFTLLTSRS